MEVVSQLKNSMLREIQEKHERDKKELLGEVTKQTSKVDELANKATSHIRVASQQIESISSTFSKTIQETNNELTNNIAQNRELAKVHQQTAKSWQFTMYIVAGAMIAVILAGLVIVNLAYREYQQQARTRTYNEQLIERQRVKIDSLTQVVKRRRR